MLTLQSSFRKTIDDEVLGDAILLSFVEYLLAYESYGMREVSLARRLWVASAIDDELLTSHNSGDNKTTA